MGLGAAALSSHRHCTTTGRCSGGIDVIRRVSSCTATRAVSRSPSRVSASSVFCFNRLAWRCDAESGVIAARPSRTRQTTSLRLTASG